MQVIACILRPVSDDADKVFKALADPSRRQLLEPPGFLALHYGYQTPLTVLVSHVVYGMILGAFYRFS